MRIWEILESKCFCPEYYANTKINFQNGLSRLPPFGASLSTDPDVRIFRIRLLTGLMPYVFMSTHGVLPLYIFHLSPHLSAVAVSFEKYGTNVI